MSKEEVLSFIQHAPPAFRTEVMSLANACQRTKELLVQDSQTAHRDELYTLRKQLEGLLLGGMLATGRSVSAGAEVNGGSILDVLDLFEHEGYHIHP